MRLRRQPPPQKRPRRPPPPPARCPFQSRLWRSHRRLKTRLAVCECGASHRRLKRAIGTPSTHPLEQLPLSSAKQFQPINRQSFASTMPLKSPQYRLERIPTISQIHVLNAPTTLSTAFFAHRTPSPFNRPQRRSTATPMPKRTAAHTRIAA